MYLITWWRPSVADWGEVCLLVAYCGPSIPLARAMGCHYLAPRYYSQCQSAVTSEVVHCPCNSSSVIASLESQSFISFFISMTRRKLCTEISLFEHGEVNNLQRLEYEGMRSEKWENWGKIIFTPTSWCRTSYSRSFGELHQRSFRFTTDHTSLGISLETVRVSMLRYEMSVLSRISLRFDWRNASNQSIDVELKLNRSFNQRLSLHGLPSTMSLRETWNSGMVKVILAHISTTTTTIPLMHMTQELSIVVHGAQPRRRAQCKNNATLKHNV